MHLSGGAADDDRSTLGSRASWPTMESKGESILGLLAKMDPDLIESSMKKTNACFCIHDWVSCRSDRRIDYEDDQTYYGRMSCNFEHHDPFSETNKQSKYENYINPNFYSFNERVPFYFLSTADEMAPDKAATLIILYT